MISNQIYLLRIGKKITQTQLAKVLNISPSTLGMYEQGRRTPSIDILIKLADYFHVSLDYLITGSEFADVHLRTPETCPCSTCFWKEWNK